MFSFPPPSASRIVASRSSLDRSLGPPVQWEAPPLHRMSGCQVRPQIKFILSPKCHVFFQQPVLLLNKNSLHTQKQHTVCKWVHIYYLTSSSQNTGGSGETGIINISTLGKKNNQPDGPNVFGVFTESHRGLPNIVEVCYLICIQRAFFSVVFKYFHFLLSYSTKGTQLSGTQLDCSLLWCSDPESLRAHRGCCKHWETRSLETPRHRHTLRALPVTLGDL